MATLRWTGGDPGASLRAGGEEGLGRNAGSLGAAGAASAEKAEPPLPPSFRQGGGRGAKGRQKRLQHAVSAGLIAGNRQSEPEQREAISTSSAYAVLIC